MSGAQTSGFPNQNDLMTVATQNIANYYAPEKNRLLIETAKQEQGAREMEAMSRVSAGLMNLDESKRADAYPGAVQYLQSLGFAKNAPLVYPGHERIAQLASLGIPAEKQYEQQGVRTAARNIRESLTGDGTGAGTATTAVPGGAYGAGGGNTAPVPAELMPHFQEASARTGIPVDVLIAQARQESSFNANAVGGAGEIGIGQILPSTARAPGYGLPGVDPAALKDPRTNINFAADYLKALLPPGADPKDPAAIRAALLRYNGGGDPNYVNNVTRYLPVPGGGTTAAATTPAPAPAVQAAPPNRLLPAIGGGPPGGGFVGIDKPGSGGNADVLGALEPAQPAPTQFAGPGVPLPPPPSTTGGFVGPGLEGGPAGNVLGGLVSVAPAAPAPAPVAPAATPPVLPPLPPAPTPTNPRTGLTMDQARTFQGRLDTARTSAQLDQVQKDIQAAREHNDVVKKEYDAAVYARQEKAQSDARSAETQRLAQEAAKLAADKAAREAAAAADPIQGTGDKANADRTLFKYADKIDADTATKEERRLYAQAAQYYLKPHPEWVDDPTDPSKKVQVNVPGQMPEGFPHPSFKPGEAPKPPPVKAAPPLTEAQSNAAGWADRMALANPLMDKLDTTALTWGQRAKEAAGKYVGYNLTSPDYQKLRIAQEAFLAGVLRKESGAAVSEAEWARYAHLYFPMPGDDETSIRLKQQFRQSTLESMQRSAGPGYKLPVAGAGGTTSTDTTAKPPPGLKIIIP